MKRMRMWTWRVVAVALVASLVGCSKKPAEQASGKEQKGKVAKIYMVVKASESEFWQIVIDGAKNAARDLEIELVAQAPVSEADISKQIAILESAIAARPDAIVLAPSSSDPLVPAIEEAAGKGIPVIVIDSGANTDKHTAFLSSDNYKIGTLSADKMAAALEARTGKAEGDIAALTFLSGANSLEQRKSGFLEQLKKKYPGINVVAFEDAQGKSGTSTGLVQNLLTAYPNLKGIYANNQPTGDETVRALDMAGRKDLAVVVVDAGAQEVWGVKNGFVDAMIVQKPWHMGYMGVEYALKAANGEEMEKFVDTGIVSITPEMMKSGEAEQYLDPVAFHKKKRSGGE